MSFRLFCFSFSFPVFCCFFFPGVLEEEPCKAEYHPLNRSNSQLFVFYTAVPFWGQTAWNLNGFVPEKRLQFGLKGQINTDDNGSTMFQSLVPRIWLSRKQLKIFSYRRCGEKRKTKKHVFFFFLNQYIFFTRLHSAQVVFSLVVKLSTRF